MKHHAINLTGRPEQSKNSSRICTALGWDMVTLPMDIPQHMCAQAPETVQVGLLVRCGAPDTLTDPKAASLTTQRMTFKMNMIERHKNLFLAMVIIV